MIFTHVLSLVVGALVGFAVLGSALKTVVLPQHGNPRLSQFVFALVYRLLVHRRRNDAAARSLRGLYAPVALVTLPLAWMILMMLAFTGIFWGTARPHLVAGLRDQRLVTHHAGVRRAQRGRAGSGWPS